MTENKNNPKKVVSDNILHHPTYLDCSYENIIPQKFIESEISSNLPLQKLLYFNIVYAIMYFYMMLLIYTIRLWTFRRTISDIIRIVFLMIILAIEILRINNGYQGNLKESFPELISFILLTVINSGMNLALINLEKPYPLEFALLLIQIIFLFLEIFIGICAIFKLVRSQTAMFYLRSPQHNKSVKFDYQKEIEMKRNYKKPNQARKFDSPLEYERLPHEENYN